ncbi:MAG TPA: hypothetical protein VI122_10225 [Thermoleophilaceae bacterium]
MKRGLMTLIAVSCAAASVAPASLANADTTRVASATTAKAWYWSEHEARRRVMRRFSDVESASCIGSGYNYRVRRDGTKLFTQFYCFGYLTDGTDYDIHVYPTGRKSFRWFDY